MEAGRTPEGEVGEFRCCWFERGFLRAGLLADGGKLILIDVTHSRDDFMAEAASAFGALEDAAPFRTLTKELAEYADGKRKTFTTRVHPEGGAFAKAVLEATARIPYGQVRSYADVARAAGSARAVRAAGNALARNNFPILIPCHRVVKTGGLLGGFGGGRDLKIKLLALEGFEIRGEKVAPARTAATARQGAVAVGERRGLPIPLTGAGRSSSRSGFVRGTPVSAARLPRPQARTPSSSRDRTP